MGAPANPTSAGGYRLCGDPIVWTLKPCATAASAEQREVAEGWRDGALGRPVYPASRRAVFGESSWLYAAGRSQRGINVDRR
jgi:hypothetical protein